jgi:hypothetical protein
LSRPALRGTVKFPIRQRPRTFDSKATGAGCSTPLTAARPVNSQGVGLKLLLCLLLLTLVGQASAANAPERVEITYNVSIGPMRVGEGRDVFEHDGKKYKVVSTSRTAGVAGVLYPLDIVRQSSGRVTHQGLRPEAFEETRNGKPKRRVRFHWNRKQALLFNGKSERTVPLPDNTWDETSFGYNFAFVAAGGPAAQQVHLTDGRRIKLYTYTIVGTERLRTALGPLDAVHVRKVNQPGDKSAFDTWIAPAYFNLPVKTRIKERGGTVFDWEIADIRHSPQ